MPPEVLQRFTWDGTTRELGDLFRLTKGRKTARCQITTHFLGWECRLLVGQELIQLQVCRTQEEVLAVGEQWNPCVPRG